MDVNPVDKKQYTTSTDAKRQLCRNLLSPRNHMTRNQRVKNGLIDDSQNSISQDIAKDSGRRQNESECHERENRLVADFAKHGANPATQEHEPFTMRIMHYLHDASVNSCGDNKANAARYQKTWSTAKNQRVRVLIVIEHRPRHAIPPRGHSCRTLQCSPLSAPPARLGAV